MSNIQFGTGVLFGLPNAGNTATNPTPYQFGTLQEVSVDFKADLKKLSDKASFPWPRREEKSMCRRKVSSRRSTRHCSISSTSVKCKRPV